MSKIYLDYNATTPLHPEVIQVVAALEGRPLNPSSVHQFGQEARKYLEQSRTTIAEAISVFPNELYFTSSGTEANNWALTAFPQCPLLLSAVEHSSVLEHAHTDNASIIPVDINGIVQLSALKELLKAHPQALVSVMLANNETGIIQPIREISELCHQYNALLHVDAAQALGKIPLDVGLLMADMMTLSAHKLGGPVGAAALMVRTSIEIPPMFKGGRQERSKRPGTENIPAIMGFAKAVELACNDYSHMQQLRLWLNAMEKAITTALPDVIIIGEHAQRLPNTSCLAFPGISSEMQLIRLDLGGVAVSAGSACTSGRITPSHVIQAMGLDNTIAASAIRISGGWKTNRADIEKLQTTLIN